MAREPYYPFTTPESKRKWGDGAAEIDSSQRTFWHALAWLQEQGRMDEWHERRDAWRAAEPRPVDLLPFKDAESLLLEEAKIKARARADLEEMWAPVMKRQAVNGKESGQGNA